ncbi:MAG: flagellar hook-length control protein FliK, partial [Phycisphaerae bacterium]|nr:flagellar hook-length control protein FliK [Phycisphaerae bacterium]
LVEAKSHVGVGVRANNPAAPGEDAFDADANAARIVRAVSSQLNGRASGTIRLHLDPPGLGQLRVELTLASNSVKVSLLPTTESTAQLLTGQLHQLRESLESRGLAVGQLQVESLQRVESGGQPGQHRPGGDPQSDRQPSGEQGGRREPDRTFTQQDWRNEPEPATPPSGGLAIGPRRVSRADRALDLVG